jgi:L-fucose isomerase-like protein
MICNEGELLEKFGIEIFPITLKDLELKTLEIEKVGGKLLEDEIGSIQQKIDCTNANEKELMRVVALKLAIRFFADSQQCTAAAIQCWEMLQQSLGVMPCLANAMLTDEGLPVTCETDIHGAVTSVMAYAAGLYKTSPFFADFAIRHSQNENGELLSHCGNFPPSLVKGGYKTKFRRHFLFNLHAPGTHEGEIKGSDMTIVRFDGDHGEYSLFLGKAKGIDGKFSRGTYVWIQVNNWLLWEDRLVTGPYIHHCVGIQDNVVPALYEACKYIDGLKPDLVDPCEDEVKAWLRGSIK